MAFYGGSGFWPVGLSAKIWAYTTMIRGWKSVSRAGERFITRNKPPSVEDMSKVMIGHPQIINRLRVGD
jgi:hypothetical protein